MDQPYSFAADWLNKFHMASEFIQALWIIALVTIVLGTASIVMRGLVELVRVRQGAAEPTAFNSTVPEPSTLPISLLSRAMPGFVSEQRDQ